MSIGWNLPTENLYQTIMGYFSPNRTPAVFIQTLMPPEIVFAHENEHRSLCQATTVGKYQSALAAAAPRCKGIQEKCEQAARGLVELCWFTHEGVATALHKLEARKRGGIDYANALNETLPIPYRDALGLFLDTISNARLEYLRPRFVDIDEWPIGLHFAEALGFLLLPPCPPRSQKSLTRNAHYRPMPCWLR